MLLVSLHMWAIFLLRLYGSGWPTGPCSHGFSLEALGLPGGPEFNALDVLNQNTEIPIDSSVVRLENQLRHSVRGIKLIDSAVPAAAPTVNAEVPSQTRVGEPIKLATQVQADGVPALSYRWDFGDGTPLTVQSCMRPIREARSSVFD